jgi:hypothetical protein
LIQRSEAIRQSRAYGVIISSRAGKVGLDSN